MQRKSLVIGVAAFLAVLVVADWIAGGVTNRLVFGTAQLSISSQPEGAQVFVDGGLVGTTPISTSVSPGEAILKLTHRFHDDHVERVTLTRDESRSMAITLPVQYGSLRIITNPKGATVTVDDEPAPGVTPLEIERLVAGVHSVRMTIAGRSAVQRSVDVLPHAQGEVSVDLERIPLGTLVVQTTPDDASVAFTDGKLVYRRGIELAVGEYELLVSHGGFAPQRVTVKINVGRNMHSVALQQQFGHLRIRATPANAVIDVRHGSGRLAQTEPYREDMRLAAGTVEVTARAKGYRRQQQMVQLGEAGADLTIALVRIDARAGARSRDRLRAGGEGPEVVVIADGEFMLGGTRVILGQPYAIGTREVTRSEYRAFANATGRRLPDAQQHETDAHPIARVDRDDAIAYTRWLTDQTGQHYRLPSEAEWEFAARAGTRSEFGAADASQPVCTFGNVADASAARLYREWETVTCDDGQVRTAAVGSYQANAFGMYDVVGNVSEWVLDCWSSDHAGARQDGRPRVAENCMNFVVRGGSWDVGAEVGVGNREPASNPADDRGFRVLREF